MWVVDAGAETARKIAMPELSPGDPPHRVAVRGDRIVLWGYDTLATDAADPGRPLDRIATDSLIWIPSADPERVWVGFPNDDPHQAGLEAVREITATGETTVSDVEPPRGYWPAVALDSGLVFTPSDGIELWDPRTRETTRRFANEEIGDLGPAHGDLLASGTQNCQEVILTDFASGTQRRIPAPPGETFDVWNGAFSPDGARLALPVNAVQSGSRAPSALALISLEDDRVTLVPSSQVPGGYTFVVWSASGDEVFITGGERFDERVIVRYRLGESSARALDVEVGDFYDAAAR
jgi:hypothetical protein